MTETSQELVSRVQAAKNLVEQRKNARLRTEAKMEALLSELEQWKSRLVALEIDPTKLDDLISESELKLEAKLMTLEAKLDVKNN